MIYGKRVNLNQILLLCIFIEVISDTSFESNKTSLFCSFSSVFP